LNVFYSAKRLAYLLISILTLTILSACSTGPSSPDDIPPELFSELNNNSAFYLNKDKQEGDLENSTWQLIATQALIEEQQYSLADPVINNLLTRILTVKQQASLQVLIAQNQFGQTNIEKSQSTLLVIDASQLSELAYIAYLKLQSEIYGAQKNHLAASDTLLVLTPLLISDAEKQQYNDILLNQLALLPASTLNQYKKSATVEVKELDSQKSDGVVLEAKEVDTQLAEKTITDELILPEETLSIEQQFKQSWYALASLYQRYQLRPNHLKRAVAQWQALYPTHSVLAFMPTQLINLPDYSPYQPENIAVVIPLSGRFSKHGKAIKYGLLNAFYLQQQKQKLITDEQGVDLLPKLYFYDSNTQTVEEIASQLEQQKIDFIIGPLLKNNVQAFLPLVKDIPVLTLNKFPVQAPISIESKPQLVATENAIDVSEVEVDEVVDEVVDEESANQQSIENEQDNVERIHYAFYLSPEDEARQAALLISQDKYTNPLVIAPDSSYGKRVAAAFNHQWQVLNSDAEAITDADANADTVKDVNVIVDTDATLEADANATVEANTQATLVPDVDTDVQVEQHFFTNKAQLAKFIEQVLHTNKSKSRINQMMSMTDLPLKTEVRSRRDIDVIYLVSKRDELILLKPFLDVSISPFAPKIPLYGSSRTHDFDRTGKQNNELSNLIFSDMPFMLNEEDVVRQQVQQVWPKQTFSTQRLFGLGFDSYQLIEQLVKLHVEDDYVYQGLVGELSLDNNNTIQPKLNWAKYYQGNLIEVAAPITAE
jgi:outer membrane PBP1 activator LpoA protein